MQELDIIKEYSDFIDERARKICESYELDLNKILPDFFECMEELHEITDEWNLDLSNPNVPLNAHNIYMKKLVAGAAICYELTKRDKVVFFNGFEENVLPVKGNALSLVVSGNFDYFVRDDVSPGYFESIGEYFLKEANELTEQGEKDLSDLCSK